MLKSFPFSKLTLALLTLPLASLSHSAAIDRSGQDVTAFLQDGTYAEAVYTYLDADISGVDKSGNKTGDIAESYDFFRYGAKADINETFSVGVLYDEPFGAQAAYKGKSNFVANGPSDAAGFTGRLAQIEAAGDQAGTANPNLPGANGLEKAVAAGIVSERDLGLLQGSEAAAQLSTAGDGTDVSLRSYNLSTILGVKFGENNNMQVYGGPVLQRAEGEVAIRGIAYGPFNGYNTTLNSDYRTGWLAGFAYSKPEIGLKAALTYRSEINHELDGSEKLLGQTNPSTVDITTPESVNFDFQTGINPTTLATAKVRYVPWSDFSIVPPQYTEVSGGPLVAYSDDQWQVELGLAKRVADNLAISGTVGWDSGAGNPVSSLGPVEGYYSVGLGAKYNVDKNWAVSVGGKYLKFGDAEGALPTGTIVSDFEDNDGYVVGVKLSYQDK